MNTLAAWLLLGCGTLLAPPPAEISAEERTDIGIAMNALVSLAEGVASNYSGQSTANPKRLLTPGDLYVAAAEQLYATAKRPLPNELKTRLAVSAQFQAVSILSEARLALGPVEELRGLKTFLVGVAGFNRVTDPYCGLMWQSGNSFAASDAEFGLGFELEGVSGTPYLYYLMESQRFIWQGTKPRESALIPPTGPRWIIRRVIPGSPAASLGLRPGDQITHLNGTEVNAETNANLFRELLAISLPDARAPGNTVDLSKPVKLEVRRAGQSRAIEVSIPRENYTPDTIFGVTRQTNGDWNYWLDEKEKLAYIRIGSVETPAGNRFEKLLGELSEAGLRGLLLDLRWCPGGYVTPTTQIVGSFLPANTVISTIKSRPGDRGNPREYISETGYFVKLPLVVLVNQETTGGGEMIAAALQDHKRATIVGQRTFGKSNIMTGVNSQFPGLVYRVSTGYSLRPNGKNRHRFPDSLPTDDWGIRPERGNEIPTTPELSSWLKAEANRQAIRPTEDRTALPFDDPNTDAQRLVALKYLRELVRKRD